MLINIPLEMAQVNPSFPGYFTDVTRRHGRRVFSAKANYGLLTEVYQDPRGRYKMYNGDKALWVTQKDLIRVRRTKNSPVFYETKKIKIRPAGRTGKQAA